MSRSRWPYLIELRPDPGVAIAVAKGLSLHWYKMGSTMFIRLPNHLHFPNPSEPPHPNPVPKRGEGVYRVRGTVIGSHFWSRCIFEIRFRSHGIGISCTFAGT